jgi:hypothetical protein
MLIGTRRALLSKRKVEQVIEQSVTGQVAKDNPSEGETEKKGVEDERQSGTGIPGSNSSTGEV